MNLQKLMELFKAYWLLPCIRSTATTKETFHSPSSVAMNNRKEAARFCYLEGYRQALRDYGLEDEIRYDI